MCNPTISVIIPTYNREALLPRALDSVVAQTAREWEIVLVDDGSTDGTAEVAARYKRQLGERLLFLQQENRGSSRARNAGIDACQGRFVAFLDSDDEFLPSKLERQMRLFERRGELGLIYSDCAYVDLEGVRHDSVFDSIAKIARRVPHTVVEPGLCVCSDLFGALICDYFIPTIVGLVRREVLGSDIRFPPDQAYAEEWLFYLKVARLCPAGFVDEPLCLHHHVQGSLARTDKRRNVRRYRDLLQAIDMCFTDLTCTQRDAVHRNLADACRQLGYDACRFGENRNALGFFADSFSYRPRVRSLSDLVQTLLRLFVPA